MKENGTNDVKAIERKISIIWWLPFAEGLIALFFGLATVFWPGLTLVTLLYLISAFLIAWGVLEIIGALISIRYDDMWWVIVVFGLVSLGAGVYFARNPGVTFKVFVIIVGLTFIIRGVMDIAASFMSRGIVNNHQVLYIFAGVAGLLAGIITLVRPVAGGLAFVWVLGLYSIIFGIVMMVAAIELHEIWRKQIKFLER